ncbi:MMPL family transporter [Nocardioides sp. Y6]|uniref:MMPL family transporter n=1 Tax=Nocardioides malaquae TaxID=2773426 RepID=A0ABR9RSL5_9ACTN|nr:MMPL family transporter [Nocardioides malaquae]MBE7324528.1 MMPL family transporter [Nocardioides malaquae]
MPTSASERTQDPHAGTNRLTRFIAGRRSAWVVALLPLLLAGFMFSLGEAEREEQTVDSLPAGFDITEATKMQEEATEGEDLVAIVLWTADEGEFTQAQVGELREYVGQAPLLVADDNTAAYTVRPVEDGDSAGVRDQVKDLRDEVEGSSPDGVTAEVTGPAGLRADFGEVFAGADVTLLIATASIVAVLLIVTYRSPILWVVPLTVVAVADRLAAITATQVMQHVDAVAWDASTVGILSVLVFGAGTNYALLLISRYRDELKIEEARHVAMARALTRTAESVLFSATTVVLGVLTLLLSATPTTRGLGLACGIGIVIAAAFALIVLPAALVLFGRWIFWPKVPKVGEPQLVDSNGFWHRVGTQVNRRPGTFVAVTLALIALMAVGFTQVKTGLSSEEQFTQVPQAVTAAERLGESFPAGTASPTEVVTRDDAREVLATVEDVEGVTSARITAENNGITVVQATLEAPPSSDGAGETIVALREALEGYDETYVGGSDAEKVDVDEATYGERLLILPMIALLVLVALMLLLRSIVAPLLLVGTVIATYAAAMGLSWWVFRGIFDFPALDQTVPLFAFLFLVALGIDYNIFLVTRAREEALTHGNRRGVLRALTATGGVITSAGILLAAVFAVLGVLPLVLLAQLGIIIFIGVLLDTLLVRTVLVPALAITLGDRFWWPRKPARTVEG